MNLRLMFIIVLLLIAPIICNSSAYADPVTTSYIETGLNNREIMRWEFSCAFLATCSGAPGGQIAWSSTVSVGFQEDPNFLVFQSTHLIGPHLLDINPGLTNFITVRFSDLVALPNNFVRIGGGPFSFVHFALIENHHDFYDLFARRNANGGFDFIYESSHVLEPTTLLLLATGLGGVAIKTRKRLKDRKSG